MARTLHTRPLRLRAERRVPFARRGFQDERRRRRARRELHGWFVDDVDVVEEKVARSTDRSSPRVVEQPPRPGFLHAATRVEVVDFLRSLPAECTHGLREVVLARDLGAFGRLLVPGRLLLGEVPTPPWPTARISESGLERLAAAGAVVGEVVEWPGSSLRDFVLRDVLLHEIGHHVFQHNRGKRTARVARTKDHEAFADLFARRARGEC